jgi:hypothetical protein
MIWVSWRQHRLEMAATLVILVALAAYLVPTGLSNFALFEESALKTCLDAAATDCSDLRRPFMNSYGLANDVVGWFNLVPAVVGLLLAIPIVSEFERRTYRLAWTQSVTRGRWIATRTGMALLGVAVFAVAFTLLLTWWHHPFNTALPGLGLGFNFAGVIPFAYTLWALSLALTAGALSRRVIATVPAALVGFLATRLPLEAVLRPGSLAAVAGPRGFWTAQAIEASVFIGASAMLLALTVWVVSRRMR